MALPSIKNSVGMAVTAVADSGQGTLTVGAALSGGYQTAGSAHGADAVSDFRFEEGDLWETAIDCAFDYSAGTVTRGTQTGGSSGPSTRVVFTTAAKVYEILDETRIRRSIGGYLEHASHDGSAAVTGVVGTLHVFTGLTADRVFTLPASAQAGDRIGITFPAGSDSYEILLKSASGDKINNVDCSSTEWSRLFIAGETVIFRCVDASTVDWIVEYDRRIPQSASMTLTTSPDGETALTFTRPTQASTAGVWTAVNDNASLTSTTGDSIKTRRSGGFNLTVCGVTKDLLTANNAFSAALFKNGTSQILLAATHVEPAGTGAVQNGPNCNNAAASVPLTTDDYLVFQYRSEEGGKGCQSGALPRLSTAFSISEVL